MTFSQLHNGRDDTVPTHDFKAKQVLQCQSSEAETMFD